MLKMGLKALLTSVILLFVMTNSRAQDRIIKTNQSVLTVKILK